jgi:hypothetical protein
MYAIVKNVAKPPRTSRETVEPRWVIWKNESSAPWATTVLVFLVARVEGMAPSVERHQGATCGGHIGLAL